MIANRPDDSEETGAAITRIGKCWMKGKIYDARSDEENGYGYAGMQVGGSCRWKQATPVTLVTLKIATPPT